MSNGLDGHIKFAFELSNVCIQETNLGVCLLELFRNLHEAHVKVDNLAIQTGFGILQGSNLPGKFGDSSESHDDFVENLVTSDFVVRQRLAEAVDGKRSYGREVSAEF